MVGPGNLSMSLMWGPSRLQEMLRGATGAHGLGAVWGNSLCPPLLPVSPDGKRGRARCSTWRSRQRVWGCGASAGPCVVEWGCARRWGLGGPWGAGGVAQRSARSPPEAAAGSGEAGRGRDGRGVMDVTPPLPAPPCGRSRNSPERGRGPAPSPGPVAVATPGCGGPGAIPGSWSGRNPRRAAPCSAARCGALRGPAAAGAVVLSCCYGVGLPRRVQS